MNKKHWRINAVFLIICISATLYSCNRHNTALTDMESTAITDISGVETANFSDISRKALTKELSAKFPAVEKVYQYDKLYAFIVKPVAYNGPITLAIVIDSSNDKSM